ncbi:GGDEF domain-containing response regulator [Altericroceibacterium xinjiangense]|uniref:GGDEF domain-containing response regulator n=1 Tax=Altericroceibacterium xinjiangense TaxID=762261 RepID=UPI001F49CBCB|nr:diguanylate cyclase [Altericroceibacterium xinjiangense]
MAQSIFIIEDSTALSRLLLSRIAEHSSAEVQCFQTYLEAREALAAHRPLLAVAGLNLPDAPDGEILDLLASNDVPTILYTASLTRSIRERFCSPNIVDYYIKNAPDAVDNIVQTIVRVTEDAATPVLIVDDMPSARHELAGILKKQNYRILEASSGAEALALLAKNEAVELVVTDYNMPDMDGYALTREIRSRYCADRVRVIGISASSDPHLSVSFLRAGASDFIYRPFIPEEVQCRIVGNVQMLEHIRHLRFLAERDPLTGLYNRRAFFEQAHGNLDEMREHQGEGSVAILDIDHFKKVNDTYGHDTGDSVIRAVAKVLLDIAERERLITARFGGEEFVTLFPGCDCDTVHRLCEEIREQIAALSIPYNDTVFSITASLGVAMVQHEEGIDNNLNAADQMLYMAKNNGRNRVMYDAVFCAS